MDSLRRPRLTPVIADVRRAVRGALTSPSELLPETPTATPADVADAPLLLVALSGGADSLALAAATAFEAPRAGLRAGAVIVDHGLQDGSAEVAARAAEQARELGLEPVLVVAVAVGVDGGMEAAARAARYGALERVLAETGARGILLGHTLDDQAETVLLGLARGSGPTSLHGMAAQTGPYLRPLLGIRRADTLQFCADSGLTPWHDPHNTDPAYARVQVRETVLPVLEAELGPGVAEALARTAEQLREDSAALDEMVLEFIEEICEPAEAGIAVSVAALAANPAALRQRVIRFVVHSEFGVTLERVHTLAIARLVTDWHGQKALNVPGVRVERSAGLLVFTAA
ncbi:tRNA lysidine(34) synthetase TilS [Microterricola viridarii]|uniref:tRNA(Ile)-lysidine synthase n=1 Tax=Microterricola viridarii TaxID=412690 RepID=A0A0Y0N0Y0_9MICO|nr:tRNA lysidine(34) synthetase TilS [Microterricola viridarii]AMB57567.1 tRNA(Ile)-lysidine synthetase [Microterricola viridarii]